MPEHKSFGQHLRQLRKARDLTQQALAQQVFCAADTIKKIEQALRRPSRQLAAQLADCLDLRGGERTAFLAAARAEPQRDRMPQSANLPNSHLLPDIISADDHSLAHQVKSLTERERTILACLAERLSNQEIADRLCLSLKTVKWYNTRIFEKLGVNNRAEAVRQFNSVAPRALTTQPKTSLPAQVMPFIGREFELHELASLLADPNVRIITLLAPGGMGKTRLAVETAARCRENFTDGVCFVSLAQIRSHADLVTAISSAIGLHLYGSGEPKQQLFDFLRRQMLLLILDNFEHLLAGTPLVAELIEAAPNSKVLITSREKLNLSSETVYALGGMTVPETGADPGSSDAVQLFLFHAHRVRRNFTPDDPSSIVRIAQLTQGMPLGLMLAASWADVLSPVEIADEISRGIDVLHQDMWDVPARHRSMRAVFDPTWERLTERQRDVFMKLSVFRGGFTREVAQAVAGADLCMLSALTGKSLIQLQPNRRYAVHELLRQYGESQLDASSAASSTHAAHSAFFMDFLAQREADVKGRRQLAALREISDDFENIRTAWLWSLAHHEFAAIDRALECLVIAGDIMGRALETQALLQHSAACLADDAPTLWERIIVRLAHLNIIRLDNALWNSRYFELVEKILGHARERNDADEIAWCMWVLGGLEVQVNKSDQQAQPPYEEMIRLCRTMGNDYLLAQGLTDICWRYANNGEIARAVKSLRESIAIRQHIGDVKNLDNAIHQLSWMIFDLLQEAETAEVMLDEQITVQYRAGTTSMLPLMMGVRAAMAFWRNDVDVARRLAQKGLQIAGNQNYSGGKRMCQSVLGLLEGYAGNYQQAQLFCQDIPASGFATLTFFLSHWVLALTSYSLDDAIGSRRSITTALHIACRYKSPTFQGMCLVLVAVMYLAKNNPQRAVEYLGFCFSQPPHLTGWLHNWPLLNDVRMRLQSRLDTATYSAAWMRGQTLDLNATAANALAELQALLS